MAKRTSPRENIKRLAQRPGKQLTRQQTGPTREAPLHSNPHKTPFPETLDRTVIAVPLLRELENERLGKKPPQIHSIIIDLNLQFPGGRGAALQYVKQKISELLTALGNKRHREEGLRDKSGVTEDGTVEKSLLVEQYLFAKLGGEAIRKLVSEDGDKKDAVKKKFSAADGAIYVWPDFKVRRLTNLSISTVKADAARASFSALGQGIVWAVLDSGIDSAHRHFKLHQNLELQRPLVHMDFTGEKNTGSDPKGHGTHVSGIIAGEVKLADQPAPKGKSAK